MTRAFWVLLHRWTGLAMAGFLIVVGLTGSLLAFWPELNRRLAPDLYPATVSVGDGLDAAILARRAERILPGARINTVYLGSPGSAQIGVEAREGGGALGFDTLVLDTRDGHELGRISWHGLPKRSADVMPFVYALHMYLAMSGIGDWILGFVALMWTIDCFVAFYLTLPTPGARSHKSFFTRWKPSWFIKRRSSAFRLNFDLHRASGLWLWAMLLVYAWSSVYFTLPAFYTRAIQLFADFEPPVWSLPANANKDAGPLLEWEQALARGHALMEAQSQLDNFTVGATIAFYRLPAQGLYEYRVRSSRDIGDKAGSTSIFFDWRSGELRRVSLPTGQKGGATFTTWLVELHMANLFGLPYRVFVCAVGILIALLSATGVYIWLKKRSARLQQMSRAL